ncbi:MAG: hypothetical protein Q8K75_11235, partial [Chlamydiales bacterium]|nr:hypothetical protein [Chlamydiales bacterium]
MQQRLFLILILSFTFFSCSQTHEASHSWQEIRGRDHLPVNRARVPSSWQRHEVTGPLHDTMLPLCEFTIDSLKIAIHNFPADTLDERIPPIAQVSRWKRQLALTEPTDSITSPVGHGGFIGMHLSGN